MSFGQMAVWPFPLLGKPQKDTPAPLPTIISPPDLQVVILGLMGCHDKCP